MFAGTLEPYASGSTFTDTVQVVDEDGVVIDNLDECTFDVYIGPIEGSSETSYSLGGAGDSHISVPAPGLIRWRWEADEVRNVLFANQNYRFLLYVSKDGDRLRLMDYILPVV